MEIHVESDANSLLLPSRVENLHVGGAAHADFGNMNDIPAFLIENERGRSRTSLIEEEAC